VVVLISGRHGVCERRRVAHPRARVCGCVLAATLAVRNRVQDCSQKRGTPHNSASQQLATKGGSSDKRGSAKESSPLAPGRVTPVSAWLRVHEPNWWAP
jgi:hypothetical protein